MAKELAQQIYEAFYSGADDFAEAWESGGNIGYSPVGRPPIVADVQHALNGGRAIGGYTLRPDSTVIWACWDIDFKPFDKAKAQAMVRRIVDVLDMQCLVEWSGQKGYHVWVLFDAPVPAAEVRPRGLRVNEILGIDVEFFPKQSELAKKGNLVKTVGSTHPKTGVRAHLVNPYTFEPLTDEEQATALSMRVSPDDFIAHIDSLPDPEPNEKIINLVAPYWVDGQRHHVGLALGAVMAKAGYPIEDATQVIQELCDQFGGDEKNVTGALKDTYKKHENGKPIAGYSKLKDLFSATDLDRLNRLIGKDTGNATHLATFGLTDLGNAERFVRQHGQNVRFNPVWGIWFIWNGRYWAKDESLEIERLAKQTIKSIYTEAGNATGKDSQEIAKWAIKSESRDRLTAMLAHARSELVISHTELDKRPDLLPCLNGTIDLKTGRLIESERSHFMTKCLPVAYDPTATCPLWEKSINQWMGGDRDMIGFLQRAIGYSATGYTTDQCLFFTYGNGSNGKSVLIETVKAALGDFAQKAPTSMIMAKANGSEGIPNDIARLPGARFAATAELEKGQRLAESRVKDLTGGDTLTARFMRGEFFEFEPTHKLWIYGNHKPVIRGSDDGIWRRIRLVPFEVKINDKDKDLALKDKLIKELPGILAWIVRGCLEWQKIGLKPPAKVTEATDEYRSEMDTLGAFFDEFCEIKPRAETPLKALYVAYQDWCDASNEHPLTSNKFSTALTERGFASKAGGKNITLKVGLKLRADLRQNHKIV